MREHEMTQLAERYLPRVKKIARGIARQLPSSVDADDLAQAAMIGLMNALRGVEDASVATLDAYLTRRIRGAILDELRAIDPLSRDQRKDARAVARATRELEHQLGGRPTEEQVAARAGVSLERVRTARELAGATTPVALDDVLHLEGRTSVDPIAVLSLEEDRARLGAAIATLPAREQTILSLYYFDELSLKEIGSLLGVTESRVCQILGGATKKLRAQMIESDSAEGRGSGTNKAA